MHAASARRASSGAKFSTACKGVDTNSVSVAGANHRHTFGQIVFGEGMLGKRSFSKGTFNSGTFSRGSLNSGVLYNGTFCASAFCKSVLESSVMNKDRCDLFSVFASKVLPS